MSAGSVFSRASFESGFSSSSLLQFWAIEAEKNIWKPGSQNKTIFEAQKQHSVRSEQDGGGSNACAQYEKEQIGIGFPKSSLTQLSPSDRTLVHDDL